MTHHGTNWYALALFATIVSTISGTGVAFADAQQLQQQQSRQTCDPSKFSPPPQFVQRFSGHCRQNEALWNCTNTYYNFRQLDHTPVRHAPIVHRNIKICARIPINPELSNSDLVAQGYRCRFAQTRTCNKITQTQVLRQQVKR